jgi:hypothetical protein
MSFDSKTLLSHPAVRDALKQAWLDSDPGVSGGHEEGGFILQNPKKVIFAFRWPRGKSDRITIPLHPQCKIGDDDIVATFHTHPNTGVEYIQSPSESDRQAVRNDPNLKGREYIGEYVIAEQTLYFISPNGEICELSDMFRKLLQKGKRP